MVRKVLNVRAKQLGVLIVDDQYTYCDIAREILDESPSFTVVGEAYDAEAALLMVGTLKPDVILMDVEMGEINGLEATHLIRSRYPGVQVVLTSIYDEVEYRRLAIMVGARAFIPKKDFSGPVLERILGHESSDASD